MNLRSVVRLILNRELHGDGDDGITAVLPRLHRGNGVRLYDRHRGNRGDGDSSHGSTAVVVTELTVDAIHTWT